MREIFHHMPAKQIALWADLDANYNRCEKGPLSALLHCCSHYGFQATDPRDRVYAILSIAKDGLGIKPDYEQSVEDVYQSTIRTLLEHGDASTLLLHYPDDDNKRNHPMPSWVTDWTRRTERGLFMSHKTGFSAAADTSLIVRFEPDDTGQLTMLFISGVRYDSITTLGPVLKDSASDADSIESVRSWLKRSAALEPNFPTEQGQNLPQSGLIGMIRTMYAVYTNRMITFDAMDSFSSLGELVLEDDGATLSAGAIALATRIHINFQDQRSFLTERGYLCMGPGPAKEQDLVVVLLGVSVPLVIRAREDGRYQLVGPAYVNGIMEGEFISERLSEEPEVFKII
jgi:hypothetical protein